MLAIMPTWHIVFYVKAAVLYIYIVADPTLLDVDQDARACGPPVFTQQIMMTHLL